LLVICMGLSYKFPELLHQRIILVRKIAGVDPEQPCKRTEVSMRQRSARFNTKVKNKAIVKVEIRGVIKKGSENSHHGRQHV
jgi:hypothetical protein